MSPHSTTGPSSTYLHTVSSSQSKPCPELWEHWQELLHCHRFSGLTSLSHSPLLHNVTSHTPLSHSPLLHNVTSHTPLSHSPLLHNVTSHSPLLHNVIHFTSVCLHHSMQDRRMELKQKILATTPHNLVISFVQHLSITLLLT